MEFREPVEYGNFYHIYNRGINSCNIFWEEENYFHFMNLYARHVGSITDCFASVLMPNHFHFLVRIHEVDEIINSNFTCTRADLRGFSNPEGLASARDKIELAEKNAYQHFSNMFNAYAKAVNKRYNRHGSLFQARFRRKLIKTDIQFRNTLIYIHNNPVKHGFTSNPEEYTH